MMSPVTASSDRSVGKYEKKSEVSVTSIEKNSEDISGNSNRSIEKSTPSNGRPKIVIRCGSKKSIASGGGTSELGGHSVQGIKPISPATSCRVESTRSPSKEEKKRKFSFALAKEDIEEDIIAMTGSKRVRRQRKKERSVKKKLDTLFPGLWLDYVNLDSYKVPETRAKNC